VKRKKKSSADERKKEDKIRGINHFLSPFTVCDYPHHWISRFLKSCKQSSEGASNEGCRNTACQWCGSTGVDSR